MHLFLIIVLKLQHKVLYFNTVMSESDFVSELYYEKKVQTLTRSRYNGLLQGRRNNSYYFHFIITSRCTPVSGHRKRGEKV